MRKVFNSCYGRSDYEDIKARLKTAGFTTKEIWLFRRFGISFILQCIRTLDYKGLRTTQKKIEEWNQRLLSSGLFTESFRGYKDGDAYLKLAEAGFSKRDIERFKKHSFTADHVLLCVRTLNCKGLRTTAKKMAEYFQILMRVGFIRCDISTVDFAYARFIREFGILDEVWSVTEGRERKLITSLCDFKSNMEYEKYTSMPKRVKQAVDVRIENRLSRDSLAEGVVRFVYGLDTGHVGTVEEYVKTILKPDTDPKALILKCKLKFDRANDYILRETDHFDKPERLLSLSDQMYRFIQSKTDVVKGIEDNKDVFLDEKNREIVKSYIDHMTEILALYQ